MDHIEKMNSLRFCPEKRVWIILKKCRGCYHADALFPIFDNCHYEADTLIDVNIKKEAIVIAH